tara:strand:+ start:215 stop:352 length:138 start_codon:yes stop_codon:yes gene_type:complete
MNMVKKPNWPKGIWPNNQKKHPRYSSKYYRPLLKESKLKRRDSND